MHTPELGWRGKGQISQLGASGTDMWVFSQPRQPGPWNEPGPTGRPVAWGKGGVCPEIREKGLGTLPHFLPLWVGQAGSWMCGGLWSLGGPADGAGEVGVLPGWDWRVGGENIALCA